MNINDILYFAPDIPFKDVDWQGGKLPDQFRARIEGFYLKPAKCCIESGHAFAAGLLLVSCVDALARLKYRSTDVGKRFKKYLTKELKSFGGDIPGRVYDSIRNGLVHEARLKNGAQFTLSSLINETVTVSANILLINPQHMFTEVQASLDAYIALLKENEHESHLLSAFLMRDLEIDISTVEQFGA
jgi:hypothetical protein